MIQENIMFALNWVKSRLSEPSTYAGLGLFLSQIAHAMTGDPTAILGVVTSLVAVVKSEQAAAK